MAAPVNTDLRIDAYRDTSGERLYLHIPRKKLMWKMIYKIIIYTSLMNDWFPDINGLYMLVLNEERQ